MADQDAPQAGLLIDGACVPATARVTTPVRNPATGAVLTHVAQAGVEDVPSDMVIAQEEIFGPVVSIMPFDTEDQAIKLANGSIYRLSGSLWTRDIGRALRVVRAVETGVISVNTSWSVHMEMPFGGVKRSGVGRELGPSALDHYSEQKSVFISNE